MSADTTTIRYQCPFCDTDKSTEKKVRRHISKSEKEDHRNVNGFKMDKTIEAVQVKDEDSGEMKSITEVSENKFGVQGPSIDDKIEKAATYFDELDNEAIKEIADEAGVSKSRVLRVYKNRGIDHTYRGRNPSTSWPELTDNQKEVLSYYYDKDGKSGYNKIAKELGKDRSNVQTIIDRYSWLLLKEYRPKGDIKHQVDKEVGVENDVDEMIDTFNEGFGDDNNSSDEGNDMLNKLSSAGVEYEVDVNITDDDFNAMKKLIKSGYDDLAEELFKE